MKLKLTLRLYRDFPGLYRGHTQSAKLGSMCWRFQCDDGYYVLTNDQAP
jgi:hypothetical protein